MNQSAKVHRAMADESRARIVDVLGGSEEPLGVADLSEILGLHTSTVRAHLDVLADAGLVVSEVAAPTGPGRPRLLYAAATSAPSTPNSGYRLLAEILASQIAAGRSDPAPDSVAAGTAWGRYLIDQPRPGVTTSPTDAVEAIRAFMDQMGFDPAVVVDGQLRLQRCPFVDVARVHPDVVCAAHLGIIRGALAALDTTVTADSLDPFVEPSVCLLHMSEGT